MSPTRDPVKPAQVSERTDLNRERLKNSYMSPATPKRRPKDSTIYYFSFQCADNIIFKVTNFENV